jgi:hypothetical protein
MRIDISVEIDVLAAVGTAAEGGDAATALHLMPSIKVAPVAEGVEGGLTASVHYPSSIVSTSPQW